MTIKDSCERCWLLVGSYRGKLWWAKRHYMGRGGPAHVSFDPRYVIGRHREKKDVIGFCHTHPSFPAVPSSRDFETMGQWVNCLGRPLICVIRGIDGLRGYWFDDDTHDPVECQAEARNGLLFGTTEAEECAGPLFRRDFCEHCQLSTSHSYENGKQECVECGWYTAGGEYLPGPNAEEFVAEEVQDG